MIKDSIYLWLQGIYIPIIDLLMKVDSFNGIKVGINKY